MKLSLFAALPILAVACSSTEPPAPSSQAALTDPASTASFCRAANAFQNGEAKRIEPGPGPADIPSSFWIPATNDYYEVDGQRLQVLTNDSGDTEMYFPGSDFRGPTVFWFGDAPVVLLDADKDRLPCASVVADTTPVPTVSALAPSQLVVEGAEEPLTVTGESFLPSSTVLWNGEPLVTTYVSETSVVAVVPASLHRPGDALITVQNSPGKFPATVVLAIVEPAPKVLALAASEVHAVVGAIIDVRGAAFTHESKILVDHVPIVSQVVSPTRLVGVLVTPPAPGKHVVQVENPAPSGASESLELTLVP